MSAGSLPGAASGSSVPELLPLLQRCHSRWRTQIWMRGLADLFLTASSLLLVLGLLDLFIGMSIAGRTLAFCVFVAGTGAIFWKRLLAPLMSSASEQEFAAAIDLAFPEFHESFATVLSLGAAETSAAEAGSPLMRENLSESLRGRLQQVQMTAVVDSSPTIRHGLIATVAVTALVLPMLLWPDGSWLIFQRILLPLANLESATNLYFEVPQASRVVARGSTVDFVAIPRWRTQAAENLPAAVTVELRTLDGRADSLPCSYNDARQQFEATLPSIQESLQYRFHGGRVQTAWFHLTVEDPPRLTSIRLQEIPPPYTGRPHTVIEGLVGDIQVFEYSDLEIQVQFNKPIATASLVWMTWQPIKSMIAEDEFPADPLPSDDTNFAGPEELTLPDDTRRTGQPAITAELNSERTGAVFRFPATGGGQFQFQIADDVGLSTGPEPSRRLIVIEDQPPTLKVTGIPKETEVRPNDIVPLNTDVRDDLGIAAVELLIQKNSDATRIVPADTLLAGSLELYQPFRLPLQDLNLNDGDVVTLTVQATDTRPTPAPHRVTAGPWQLHIRHDAEPLEKQPLSEQNQALIDTLRQLADALTQDIQTGSQLRDQVRKAWDQTRQEDVQKLSEKEQLQGRQIQQAAQEAADHPLMTALADDLQRVGTQVRDAVPDLLSQARAAEGDQAAQLVQEGVNQLTNSRDQLQRLITELESLAQIEQDLTELNRLALEAEQLTRESEQLDRDRNEQQPEPGQTAEELQQQLNQKAEQLQDSQEALSRELEDLLDRQKELLAAARRAQLDRLQAAGADAEELAQLQQRLADAVAEESREAARDTAAMAGELQHIKSDTDTLNQQLQEHSSEISSLPADRADDAARALRQGNLKDAQENLASLQAELDAAVAGLQSSTDPAADTSAESPDHARAAELTEKAGALDEKLSQLQKKIQDLVDDRAPQSDERISGQQEKAADERRARDTNADDKAAAGEDSPSASPSAPNQESPESSDASTSTSSRVLDQLMERLQQLAQASEELTQTLEDNPTISRDAVSQARSASQKAAESSSMAQAGQFAAAANKMREAGTQQHSSAAQVSDEQHADQKLQLDNTGNELKQLADLFQQLQQDNSAQAQMQQATQAALNQQTQELSARLKELAERMNLDPLGLQSQARQATAATSASEEAADATGQSAGELENSQLSQAAQSGHRAAGHLNRAAQLAQQGAQQNRPDQNPAIPNAVGDSVTDALESLSRAGRATQPAETNRSDPATASATTPQEKSGEQQSTDSAAGDAGPAGASTDGTESSDASTTEPSGQADIPQSANASGSAESMRGKGESSPRTGDLANAAEALASAARGSLPASFNPGQMEDASSASGKAQAATGNDQKFDGRTPHASNRGGSRWFSGGFHDELDDPLSDAGREIVDNEYAELIRNYRRQLANPRATTKDSPGDSAGGKNRPSTSAMP